MASNAPWLDTLKDTATNSKDMGPGSWGLLHLAGLEADEDRTGETHKLFLLLVKVLAKRFKANDCREHFKQYAEENAVKKGRAFEWSIGAHNAVNKRQNKRELTLDDAYSIWGPDNIRIAPCSGEEVTTNTYVQPIKGTNPTYVRNTQVYGQQPGYYTEPSPAQMTSFGPLALVNSIMNYHSATQRR